MKLFLLLVLNFIFVVPLKLMCATPSTIEDNIRNLADPFKSKTSKGYFLELDSGKGFSTGTSQYNTLYFGIHQGFLGLAIGTTYQKGNWQAFQIKPCPCVHYEEPQSDTIPLSEPLVISDKDKVVFTGASIAVNYASQFLSIGPWLIWQQLELMYGNAKFEYLQQESTITRLGIEIGLLQPLFESQRFWLKFAVGHQIGYLADPIDTRVKGPSLATQSSQLILGIRIPLGGIVRTWYNNP